MSYLIANPEDRFSRDEAQILLCNRVANSVDPDEGSFSSSQVCVSTLPRCVCPKSRLKDHYATLCSVCCPEEQIRRVFDDN